MKRPNENWDLHRFTVWLIILFASIAIWMFFFAWIIGL